MIHSIISDYDIFYSSERPEFTEKRTKSGITTLMKVDGKLQPYSFFSTDPKAYLNHNNNKINSL